MEFDPFRPSAIRRLDIEAAVDEAVQADPGAWRRRIADNLAAMDDWRRGNESERSHLGASVLGVGCPTRVALDYRKATTDRPDGRLIRLFQRGHMEEARAAACLQAAGIAVRTISRHGGQITYRLGGVQGSVDGVCRLPDGRLAVLEIKTMSARPFDDLLARESIKHQHIVQMACGMAGLCLDTALYVAVHKDTDRVAVFEVRADPGLASSADALAVEVVHGAVPPVERPRGHSVCRYCPHKAMCHDGDPPVARCETCAHARAGGNGLWSCDVATFGVLCDHYQPIQIQPHQP